MQQWPAGPANGHMAASMVAAEATAPQHRNISADGATVGGAGTGEAAMAAARTKIVHPTSKKVMTKAIFLPIKK